MWAHRGREDSSNGQYMHSALNDKRTARDSILYRSFGFSLMFGPDKRTPGDFRDTNVLAHYVLVSCSRRSCFLCGPRT